MTKEKMTIHEGLSTLKTLNKRIEKEIKLCVFLDKNKHSNIRINGKSIDDYKNDIKASYQTITDLIKRREALKRAITLSNATTIVTVAGKTMTVAEAIEYKNTGIEFKQLLLDTISNQYTTIKFHVEANNGVSLEDKANDYVQRMFGNKESGVDNSVIAQAKQQYIDNNTLDIIDPLNVTKVMQELQDEIDLFNSKVDSALSTSNALTMIEFEY